MSLFIKICGLKEQQHVQAAVDAGADAVGFVFADSVRRISPGHAAAMCDEVPSRVRRVAVMRHPSNAEWQDVHMRFRPDVLQTDADDFTMLRVPDTVERWPVYREGQLLTSVYGRYLYEGPVSGSGETVDWSQAAALARNSQMILAGGLGAGNIADAIATVLPYGVDVSSAVESAPGQKASTLISDFIEAARAAAKTL